jgi:hypothetical protein
LKTESRCEFCKSIFKICYALSKLSVDCLLLFNDCIQSFLKISSMRGNIRRCISMRILEIMVCLKRWLWSLCNIVITLSTEIWVISPTRVVCLRVSHVTRMASVDDFSFVWLIGYWESPPSIWFRVTRKPRCTGLYQRFTGKGLVVVREGISTPNAPYLR